MHYRPSPNAHAEMVCDNSMSSEPLIQFKPSFSSKHIRKIDCQRYIHLLNQLTRENDTNKLMSERKTERR